MDKQSLDVLLKLKERLTPVKDKCQNESFLIVEDMNSVNDNILAETLRLGRIYARGIKLLATQKSMYKKVKKTLINMGLYTSDEIALDVNELVSMGSSAKAVIGPVTYTRELPLECLTNLEFIWSDADFSNLYNSEYIKNLCAVFGKLTMGYISSPVNLRLTADVADFTTTKGKLKLPNYKVALSDVRVSTTDAQLPLEILEGNIFITEDEEITPNAFTDIKSFDGFVYYEKIKKLVSWGEVYSLEEYLSQKVKIFYS